MKKLKILKFSLVVLTIWASDALISYSIFLLNFRQETGTYDVYYYPYIYNSIAVWFGITLAFLSIPILLWVWYYFEIRKIKMYYQNLAISGTDIISTVNKEVENLIGRGILSKEEADAKTNHLIREYENEIFVEKSINDEQKKLNSLNSLFSLKAIDDLKYQTEKRKIKDEIIVLKGESGLGIKMKEINKYVIRSFFDTKFLFFSVFIFGFLFFVMWQDENYDFSAIQQYAFLQLLIFLVWSLMMTNIKNLDKNERNFWRY